MSARLHIPYRYRKNQLLQKANLQKAFLHIQPFHLNALVFQPEHIPIPYIEPATEELGLAEGTAVYGGGGDASLIGVGAGATEIGDTHIYSGTSGWVGTVVPEQLVDAGAMMAAIVGANPENYNYFAELETSNKCMGWVKEHLALDEIGVFLKKYGHKKDDLEEQSFNLYDYLEEVIDRANPGSDGVIFTPWLHGNRCPFEDPNAAGMFFNIHLETGKTELIRAVVEGVCFHMRWMLERQEQKVAKYKKTNSVRFCGGGALGAATCQILADILQRDVEVVDSPQNIGAVGAAACIAVGTGMISSMTEVIYSFYPQFYSIFTFDSIK